MVRSCDDDWTGSINHGHRGLQTDGVASSLGGSLAGRPASAGDEILSKDLEEFRVQAFPPSVEKWELTTEEWW